MEDFNIGAMKARNIAAQFGVIEKAETSYEEVMKHSFGEHCEVGILLLLK